MSKIFQPFEFMTKGVGSLLSLGTASLRGALHTAPSADAIIALKQSCRQFSAALDFKSPCKTMSFVRRSFAGMDRADDSLKIGLI
jgi:hypothetical protein